ncbi:Fe-Mn family superoxide dismutase [Blochmannia endosymbiont of Camponotus sp.]|uniref:Fe-Mn family superoxide dismutase n=1 Tax=Blochmannia endosymbiont of Camponotus sp. TaxID=700220 RepID=UPI0020248945|nr:Fe-Mn family superoxide dismutase [Blochmannia endosymbiont of Camponotus sp.]URJ29767.1 superoxide dismutase [Mn] [Blochmannia endosymbiont of Camponotus sp.]URJ31333.1 superoxide dismutase [Mn] [Blochmannia endosymbiont of Camponotus sp.]
MSFTLPSLTYPYNALEPFFDEQTMKIHHTKHHQAYIDNANAALIDLPEFSNLSIIELIQKLNNLPNQKKTILRNNAGGHINHSFFWKLLKKNTTLQGSLKDAIEHNFSSISSFKDRFEKTAISHFGSGWVWLTKQYNTLSIVSTANQDNPLMGTDVSGTNGYPLLGLDIWEHAYYLKYQNRRLDYVKSFWHVVNWDEVSAQFNQV